MMRLIDLLLLKRRVFRHYLFNSTEDFAKSTVLMFFVIILVKPIFYCYRAVQSIGRIDIATFCMSVSRNLAELALWLLFMSILLHRHAGFTKLSSALILSNFYYIFIFVMLIWKYREEEYLMVVDFLCLACNSIVVSEMYSMSNEIAAGYVYACKFSASLVCRELFPSG